MRHDYDLGLLIPLREEFDQAREVFEFGAPENDGGYFLYPFTVPGTGLRGLALVLFEMGLGEAAVAVTYLLGRFELGVLAMAGIAGALEPDLRLGDVVIAKSVDEYLAAAKATAASSGRYDFEVAGATWTASRDLVTYAQNFRYLGDGFKAWQQRAAARLPAASKLARPEPDYLVAPIASGDVVGADEEFAQWLLRHNRFRAALEMEAGGAARAVYRSGQTDLLVVRGISDFADKRKKKLDAATDAGAQRGAWRRYAALNAFDLLGTLAANPEFPWRKSKTTAEPAQVGRLRLIVEELQGQFPGDDHRVLAARNNLARACTAAGRPDLALPHYEVIAASFAKTKGYHPDALTARSNLAAAYRAAGRPSEAIELDEQVLADRARVLGADHPDTIASRSNLAADHFEADDVGTAITMLQQVVADRERILGLDHPDTRAARDSLAVARQAQLASSGPGS
jgi:nucleoside phosphorylase